MMSAAKISGIFSRDSFDRRGLHDPRHARAIAVEHAGQLALARFLDLLLEVRARARRVERQRATPPPQAEAIRLSWPAFSSSVMRAISGSTNAGNVDSPGGLEQRPGRAREPRGHGARAHQRRAARNARVQHALPLHCRLARAHGRDRHRFVACLTVHVTGYMSHANSNCNRLRSLTFAAFRR